MIGDEKRLQGCELMYVEIDGTMSPQSYKEYRDHGFPIGSGLVEGSCKFVDGKRFKGSGMRWKMAENEKVLKVRLAKMDGFLPNLFTPKPQEWTAAA